MLAAAEGAKLIDENSSEASDRSFARARALSLALAAGLSDADATAQSMADASPAKWHLAHSSWFFETFLLEEFVPDYRPYNAEWSFLFNSYYDAKGPRVARDRRGLLTRPSLAEIIDYRRRIDDAIVAAMPIILEQCADRLALGIHHEQQHQELMLTDLKHLFFQNPLAPAAWPNAPDGKVHHVSDEVAWHRGGHGPVNIGAEDDYFAFDCERPVHRHYLSAHALADRPVSNGEWIAFIEDGGYATPSLWLADGLAWVRQEDVGAPLYWRRGDDGWEHFTLSGWQPVNPSEPVAHISFFEADAFAAWAGARLPTEQEWESAARRHNPYLGIQLDEAGPVRPRFVPSSDGISSMFGNVWEWTASPFRPHPRFRADASALGEYNGKFMNGQFVLKGGSCATPRGHLRASYRNFFHPQQRWQFSGMRLAKDI